jgi:hypothetical protein
MHDLRLGQFLEQPYHCGAIIIASGRRVPRALASLISIRTGLDRNRITLQNPNLILLSLFHSFIMIALTTTLRSIREELPPNDASSFARTDRCKIASEPTANLTTAHSMTYQRGIATGCAFATHSLHSNLDTEQLCRRTDWCPHIIQQDHAPCSGSEGLICSDDANDLDTFFDSRNVQKACKPKLAVDWRLRSSELMACIRDYVYAADFDSSVSWPTTRMERHSLVLDENQGIGSRPWHEGMFSRSRRLKCFRYIFATHRF